MGDSKTLKHVILADDHASVRSSLRLLLNQEPALTVVGEAADAQGLLRLTAEQQPDLLLLDWELPGLPLPQLIRLLRYERPQLLVVAMSSRPESCHSALAGGANAFLGKTDAPEQVMETIWTLPAAPDPDHILEIHYERKTDTGH